MSKGSRAARQGTADRVASSEALLLFRFHRSLGPPCCFAFAFGCGELLFRCFETKNQSLATMSFDESKAEVAEAEDDDLGDRLRKQFEDGLITEEEMNKNLQA